MTLRLRPSARDLDVIETIRRWIVIPGCEISVTIDGESSSKATFESPKEAVEQYLRETGRSTDRASANGKEPLFKVVQEERKGVTLAYALHWSEYFREWSFVSEKVISRRDGPSRFLLGTCIEGIRVQSGTPGFLGDGIVALANLRGPEGPKTNVARSVLEDSPELEAMLDTIYSLYCDHVRVELKELQEARGFSKTWAIGEARHLIAPLTAQSNQQNPQSRESWKNQITAIPALIIEREGERLELSPLELAKEPVFWTIDSQFVLSAEVLIREAPGNASLSDLLKTLHGSESTFPDGPVLSNFSTLGPFTEHAFENREIANIEVFKDQRRVNLRWVNISENPRWVRLPDELENFQSSEEFGLSSFRRRERLSRVVIGCGDVGVSGLSDEIAVRSAGSIYILPGSSLSQHLVASVDRFKESGSRDALVSAVVAILATNELAKPRSVTIISQQVLDRILQEIASEINIGAIFNIKNHLSFPGMYEVFLETNWNVFDISAWVRSND